jgi:GAF domain-containing protein
MQWHYVETRFIASMPRESRTDQPGRPLTRLARGERVVRLPDLTKEEIYRTNPAYREFIDATGIRTAVMVALRKDEALLGAIAVHRKEVLPITERQIALLQNFAWALTKGGHGRASARSLTHTISTAIQRLSIRKLDRRTRE